MQYFDPEKGESYIPYVIETSIGVDRMFLHVISAAWLEEELMKEDGSSDTRVVLRLPPFLAPVKLAVMPLVKKDGLPEIAEKIVDDLKFEFNCQYDDKDSIGRRYRRQDAIGTPYCITIDHQTLEDKSVTVRYRDSMEQERVIIDNLKDNIRNMVDMSSVLKKIQSC
jgi:glycyl-tRNA synthetase